MKLNLIPIAGLAILVASQAASADAEAERQDDTRPAAPAIGLTGPGIPVTDMARALRFYRDGLGITEINRLDGSEVTEVILSFTQTPRPPFLFLLRYKDKKKPSPSSGNGSGSKLVLNVMDVDATYRRLSRAGYKPDKIVEHAQSGARVFWVSDPDGQRLEIVQRGQK